MVKNAMDVGLPNCSLRGIQAAVALGAAGGDCGKGLAILSAITEEQKQAARSMAQERKISLALVEKVPPVYIAVEAFGKGHRALAVISGEHDRFAFISHDDQVLVDIGLDPTCEESPEGSFTREMLADLSLKEILTFADQMEPEGLDFVLQGAHTNMAIAQHAMEHDYGLCVGKTMGEDLPDEPGTLNEAYAMAAAYAAAASDARMAGCPLPVVINSGSGNQGITVSVPLLILARYLRSSESALIKALCVSELVALTLTARKDRLSALCGAFTAAIGTTCGMVSILGGDLGVMDRAVNNMVANLTGIICDGAKTTCALKIHSCVEAASMSCRLAFHGLSPREESGIVGKDALQSFSYLSRISHEGMEQTDRTILSIMMDKQEKCGT
jgi:L-cysteine desulfidase